MRVFFAIPCPPEASQKLIDVLADLQGLDGLKRVDEENHHITIKFLGDVGFDFCRRLDSGIQKMLPALGVLHLKIKHVGVFPNPSNPRVLWAGVRPQNPLIEINAAVEKITSGLGIKKEKRDYQPHITLGRLKNPPADPRVIVDWLKKHGNDEFADYEAPELVLYESELTQQGPVYREVMKWPL